MDQGAMIIPGAGHVLVVGPFAMVMSGTTGDAQTADEAFASIAERRAWTFEAVADALQELVVSRDLNGVAAVLTSGRDPVVFIFDEAMAIFDGSAHGGSGRDEWVTEMVMGHSLELRLAGQSTMPPQHGTSLRDGLVPGAGLSLELALVLPSEQQQPPPPRFNAPPQPIPAQPGSTGPLAQYGYQPPPPTNRIPPPPHQGAGRDAPGRVHHHRPPPPPE